MNEPQQAITSRKRNVLITAGVILLSILVLFIVLIIVRVTKKKETQVSEECAKVIEGKQHYYTSQGSNPCEAIKTAIHDSIGAGSCDPCNPQDPRDANWGNYTCEPYAGMIAPYCG
jgi:hypothetical protein